MRERERDRENTKSGRRKKRKRCRTTSRNVYERCYSAARCVSVCRAGGRAEVDGLAFERHRRRSAVLGTRSVMESLAAPSVEAMTPSTPLLPPNRPAWFPSCYPLSLSPPSPRPSLPDHPSPTRLTPLPSLRVGSPLPWVLVRVSSTSSSSSPHLSEGERRGREREGVGESRQCRRYQHRAKLGACIRPL